MSGPTSGDDHPPALTALGVCFTRTVKTGIHAHKVEYLGLVDGTNVELEKYDGSWHATADVGLRTIIKGEGHQPVDALTRMLANFDTEIRRVQKTRKRLGQGFKAS